MRIPTADIYARHFQPQARFYQLRDGRERFAVASLRITGAIRRRIFLLRYLCQVAHRLQRLLPLRFDKAIARVERGQRVLDRLRFFLIALQMEIGDGLERGRLDRPAQRRLQ